MTCMCGDLNCPSCGPLQGHDPTFERVCEWFDTEIFKDKHKVPECIDLEWLSEFVASAIEHNAPEDVIEAIEIAAHKWSITPVKPMVCDSCGVRLGISNKVPMKLRCKSCGGE